MGHENIISSGGYYVAIHMCSDSVEWSGFGLATSHTDSYNWSFPDRPGLNSPFHVLHVASIQ